jgi:putative transposase
VILGTRLRHRGIRTSLCRVLRLMPEHGLLAPSRSAAARGPSVRDGTSVPDPPDTMRGTDLTAARTREGPAAVFIAVDHCSVGGIGLDRHRPVVAWRMP